MMNHGEPIVGCSGVGLWLLYWNIMTKQWAPTWYELRISNLIFVGLFTVAWLIRTACFPWMGESARGGPIQSDWFINSRLTLCCYCMPGLSMRGPGELSVRSLSVVMGGVPRRTCEIGLPGTANNDRQQWWQFESYLKFASICALIQRVHVSRAHQSIQSSSGWRTVCWSSSMSLRGDLAQHPRSSKGILRTSERNKMQLKSCGHGDPKSPCLPCSAAFVSSRPQGFAEA